MTDDTRAWQIAAEAYDNCDHIPDHEREARVAEMTPVIAAALQRERDTLERTEAERDRLKGAIEDHLSCSGMLCENLTDAEMDGGVSVCDVTGCTYCGLSRALAEPPKGER